MKNRIVDIPTNSDLNTPNEFEGKKHHRHIADSAYESLPPFLKELCELYNTANQRDTFLISALGVISGLLPNVITKYGGNVIWANLYVYIVGKAGVGKGVMSHAKALGKVVHQKLIDETKQALKDFKLSETKYKCQLKEYESKSGKSSENEPPEEPEEPKRKMLFIPANNSSSGLYQNLDENDQRGIIVENEGDTLANSLKTDHGNFSNVLRLAFEHETLSLNRKTGRELIEMEKPRLSVVITSTFDQMMKLIPNAENGLLSRIAFHNIHRDPKFYDPFDERNNTRTEKISESAIALSGLYEYLRGVDEPVVIKLTKDQQKSLSERFQRIKDELCEFVGEELDGTSHRLAIIFTRILMILTVLRKSGDSLESGSHFCSQKDFNCAWEITDFLRLNALEIYYQIKDNNQEEVSAAILPDEEKLEQKKKAFELRNQGLSYREISVIIFGSENQKSTVYRWLKS